MSRDSSPIRGQSVRSETWESPRKNCGLDNLAEFAALAILDITYEVRRLVKRKWGTSRTGFWNTGSEDAIPNSHEFRDTVRRVPGILYDEFRGHYTQLTLEWSLLDQGQWRSTSADASRQTTE